MTNPDFEKTQLWANNLSNATAAPIPAAVASVPAAAKPLFSKKPALKKLSKEEKIILASGGALAVGLGAIVITSLPASADPLPTPPPVEATDLAAPILNLETLPEVEEVKEPEPAAPVHRPRPAATREHATSPPPPPPPTVSEQPHALLEIPDTPEVATSVGDDLTFIEAFNTARAEVGPAGLFAWRNTYYSTFTDKEWESVPENQKEQWLEAAEPIIDPGYENLRETTPEPEPVVETPQNVIIAERGALVWTGIDRNGDGQVEVLMGRINGQSPMVLMDTDGDGILDTRFDFDAGKGKAFASQIEPFSMSSAEIEHLEYVPIEENMGFFNDSERTKSTGLLPVSIFEKDGHYIVTMDSNNDNTIDAITYLSDEKGPVVGLDYDNDGQIEMGYTYNSETQSVLATEVEPLEEMTVDDKEIPQFSGVEYNSDTDDYLKASKESELAFEDDVPDDETADQEDASGYGDSDEYSFS